MKRTALLCVSFLFGIASLHATTWHVGPARQYTAPSQVSTLVQDGDTVLIDAGVYEADVARWGANNLLLKGAGGFAHLKANGANYGGKAIWVIGGNNTTVDSIEFSLCSCPDNNGAGIRQEGVGLTVRDCFFHDNQEGILAGDNPTSDILIERSKFYNNGAGDGYSHNLYINHVNSLTFRYNYSHHAVVGHELKSRAYHNYILYNRLANEATGTASREIDLPNGGMAIIIGNEIEQGPNGTNSDIIGYGLEGLSNPARHDLVLVNNTLVNDRSSGTFVRMQDGTALYKEYNNIFAEAGDVFTTMTYSGTPVKLDIAANSYGLLTGLGLVDVEHYDYHLQSSSIAIEDGVDPGFDSTFALTPNLEYQYPTNGVLRAVQGSLDVGAHEFSGMSGVARSIVNEAVSMGIYPNPATDATTVRISGAGASRLVICDEIGTVMLNIPVSGEASLVIGRDRLAAGIYFARLIGDDGLVKATQIILVR